ncbi:hypothetical protein ABT373_36705 [Streptomyces sp. NPDC000070]|uniref:hypothetical protein n=1 Tax=Streptomyces sp. NPDC000070 TaxID=3154240 RepID=UPI00333093D4
MTPELTDGARNFRLRMAVIDRESEVALDMTCDRYGRTVHADAAAAARAHRNRAAVEAYTTHLAPHADISAPPDTCSAASRRTQTGFRTACPSSSSG